MTAPQDRKYTRTHEWVQIENDVVTIGLTDYAQQELGDITYLELPEPGDSVSSGEAFGVVESVKAASDVYSPIDGEVVARNDNAVEGPEVINASPYNDAWLIKVRVADPAPLDALMNPDDYDTYAAEAVH
jgi:glycine cleavage system H protein